MPRTRGLFVASFALIVGLTFGFFLSGLFDFQKLSPVDYGDQIVAIPLNVREAEFKTALETVMRIEKGKGIGGYTPDLLLEVFPGFQTADFNNVSAVVGRFEFKEGQLSYTNSEVVDGVAGDISDDGYRTLYRNLSERLAFDSNRDIQGVIDSLRTKPGVPVDTQVSTSSVACSKEAKVCPDGSSLGRSGPRCEFAACPATTTSQSVICTDDQRLVDVCTEQYEPVCAAYQVQCITTPCNPVPKTYSNSCFACQNKNTISYTKGECAVN